MSDRTKDSGNERQAWVIWATALVSLLVFLLIALLMIGIPFLNANLIRGTGFSSADLASWQITALISMVGMLIGAVFIITAFRMEATARHVASNEAKDVVDKGLQEEKKRLGDCISGANDAIGEAESKLNKLVEGSRAEVATLISGSRKDMGEALENGKSAIDRVVQDAQTRTTEAINNETSRFTKATGEALEQSERQFQQSIERIQTDGAAVREFLDERAAGLVREAFTAERLDAIQERVADKLAGGLPDEVLAARIGEVVQAMVKDQPQLLVEPVAERVAGMGRWRWLFRTKGKSSG